MTGALAGPAAAGFSNGTAYDVHRAVYPVDAVSALVRALGLTPNSPRILDLAAGTGKFTEPLARVLPHTQILAVEPHDAMRACLQAKVLPNVTVKTGYATRIPAADTEFDAVVVAQAFHWFANPESLREIHRVLKPGGGFGMIWNIDDYNGTQVAQPATAWEAALKELVWSFDDDEPRFRHDVWPRVFKSDVDHLFSLPLKREEVPWTVWLPNKDALWHRLRTLSQFAVLEGKELQRVKGVFDNILNSYDVETNAGGEMAIHGTTYLAWTVKTP